MKKLLELLNEYENTLKPNEQIERTENGVKTTPLIIISKKFKFIKRLVEKEKIDLAMVREKLGIPCCVWYGSGRIIAVKDVEDYKQILMLLSISNSPIEDLISYLK